MSDVKLPHMPLWVYDIESDEDCVLMTPAEFGIFVRLLIRQWIEDSVPENPVVLAKLLRYPESDVMAWLEYYGHKMPAGGDGRRRNDRLTGEREDAVRKVLQNRENGKRGGRPPLNGKNRTDNRPLNQTDNHRQTQRGGHSESEPESEISSSKGAIGQGKCDPSSPGAAAIAALGRIGIHPSVYPTLPAGLTADTVIRHWLTITGKPQNPEGVLIRRIQSSSPCKQPTAEAIARACTGGVIESVTFQGTTLIVTGKQSGANSEGVVIDGQLLPAARIAEAVFA